MSKRVRIEEYSPLADCIVKSFERDQEEIVKRFPRLDGAFLEKFKTKIAEVKVLDKEIVLTEKQKNTSDELYAEADELNTELNFLSTYLSYAELDNNMVWMLKKDLIKGNFEEAIFKIEGLKQFVISHCEELESEGMSPYFPRELEVYRISLNDKNTLHSKTLKQRKEFAPAEKNQYASLSAFISTVSYAGKVVFDGTEIKQEYNIKKILSKMRTPKKSEAY